MARALVFALALLAALDVSTTAAAEPLPPSVLADPVKAPLARRYRAARVRRDVGVGVGAVGLASLAAGAVLVGSAFTVECNPECYDTIITSYIRAGASLLGVGFALTVTGSALAIQGQNVMSDVGYRLGVVTWRPLVAPLRAGAMVGATLSF